MSIPSDVLAGDQKYINETHQNEPQRKGRRYPDCEIHCSPPVGAVRRCEVRFRSPRTPQSPGLANSPKANEADRTSPLVQQSCLPSVRANLGSTLHVGTHRISVWSKGDLAKRNRSADSRAQREEGLISQISEQEFRGFGLATRPARSCGFAGETVGLTDQTGSLLSKGAVRRPQVRRSHAAAPQCRDELCAIARLNPSVAERRATICRVVGVRAVRSQSGRPHPAAPR